MLDSMNSNQTCEPGPPQFFQKWDQNEHKMEQHIFWYLGSLELTPHLIADPDLSDHFPNIIYQPQILLEWFSDHQ